MRVMITGGAGFVGHYVADALRRRGHEPIAYDLLEGEFVKPLDIRNATEVDAAVAKTRPDACVHLAGVAFVPDAARDPDGLNQINVEGTRHLAEALVHHVPGARMLFASTAQVYGAALPSDKPLDEGAPLNPSSPYAASKIAAEKILREHFEVHGLQVLIGRPGNHTGPGQSPKFVVPAFIAAIRAYRDGLIPIVPVGNLESERDFTDVRDVVEAYLLLLEKGTPGGVYNIAAGMHLRIGELLDRVARLAGVTPKVERRSDLYRPTDAFPALETRRLRQETNWSPRYDLDMTLRDIWQETEAG